jgi:hypothetical protein
MWISTPVRLFERKPLPFFITLPLLALPSRSLLRTGLCATRYPSSVCRLEVLFRYALPVCPPRKRWRGVAFITYLYMLHHTFSVSRYLTLFYNVSTPLRALCMSVGVAFRKISKLCLQGENALAFPFALLPSPSVTFTQIYTYNVYINVPALAVSIPHALRVTLPLSLEQVVSNISINPRRVTGTLPRWNLVQRYGNIL